MEELTKKLKERHPELFAQSNEQDDEDDWEDDDEEDWDIWDDDGEEEEEEEEERSDDDADDADDADDDWDDDDDDWDDDEDDIIPSTTEEILVCLKRLLKSSQTWTKRAGRQGYLQYIEQFLS